MNKDKMMKNVKDLVICMMVFGLQIVVSRFLYLYSRNVPGKLPGLYLGLC